MTNLEARINEKPAKRAGQKTLVLEKQGVHLRLKVHGVCRPVAGGNKAATQKRGQITNFSRKSKKRLLDLFARMEWPEDGVKLITLTYPREFPSPSVAKSHLDTFIKRIRRLAPEASGIWRLEFQKRGAPHFHLMMFNMPYWDKAALMNAWSDVIGVPCVFTRIEQVKNRRAAIGYVAKYMAKQDGLDLTTGHTSPIPIGRVWGVINRSLLPLGDMHRIVVTDEFAGILFLWGLFRRAFRDDHEFLGEDNGLFSLSVYSDDAALACVVMMRYLEHYGVELWKRRTKYRTNFVVYEKVADFGLQRL